MRRTSNNSGWSTYPWIFAVSITILGFRQDLVHYSSAKEEGYLGNVKRIVYREYKIYSKGEDIPVIRDSLMYVIVYTLDKLGNFDTVTSTFHMSNDFYAVRRYTKSGSKISGWADFDVTGKKTSGAIITWKDQHTYFEKDLDESGKCVANVEVVLDSDYRRNKYIIKWQQEDGTEGFKEEQRFIHTKTGKKIVTKDLPKGEERITEIKILKRDEKGNPTEALVTSGQPIKRTYWEWEYY